MRESLGYLRRDYIIEEVAKLAKKQDKKIYLVGGLVRDLILGIDRPQLDIDLALEGDAVSFAKKFSLEVGGSFVLLDRQRGYARVVYENKKRYTVDFVNFRGKNIQEDLSRRDFTINGLALALDDFSKTDNLSSYIIDPYGGLKDIKRKAIVAISKKSFLDDPARILRAFSLAATLHFKITLKTQGWIRHLGKKIILASAERIRDCLFEILANDNSVDYFYMMDKLGLIDELWPQVKPMRKTKQGPCHHLDVWGHSLETLERLENILNDASYFKNKKIRSQIDLYIEEPVAGVHKKREVLKLAALLHDIGKPATLRLEGGKISFHGHEKIGSEMLKGLSDSLKLSNRETDILTIITLNHLRPGYLAQQDIPTKRAVFRFFRDTKGEALGVLLVALADREAMRGRKVDKKRRLYKKGFILFLIEDFFKSKQERLPRLITGDDLIQELKLSAGPVIGKILREIEELQAEGSINSKETALDCARNLAREFAVIGEGQER